MIGILNIAQQAYSRYSHPPRAIPASLFMRNEEFGLATKDGDGNYIYTNIPFDLLIDESHELDFDITDHAVENGSTISDANSLASHGAKTAWKSTTPPPSRTRRFPGGRC